MSDPRKVPPAPGTEPRVSKQPLRSHREDATIYESHREKGTHPYTDDEIGALIVANAADAAATKSTGEGPLDVPLLRELVALFRYRLHLRLPDTAEQRTRGRKAWNAAEVKRESALIRGEQCLNRRRELESTRRRLDPPVGGAKFTRPWWLLACLVPAVVIELFGSVNALEAAFKLGRPEATLFAASISVILVIAADQFGNLLASISRGSRKAIISISIALVVVAIGCGIWAVATLAGSREANLAFKGASERPAESGSGNLGTAKAPKSAAGAAGGLRRQSESRRSEGVKPDIGFFVPLSTLILAASTLLAFRIEGAGEWNQVESEIGQARSLANSASRDLEEAVAARTAAEAVEQESTADLAAYVELQHGLLTAWIARFGAEYNRFCAAEQCQPRELAQPDVPPPGQVLHELLQPGSSSGPQPPPQNGSGPNRHAGTGRGSAPGQEAEPAPTGGPGRGEPEEEPPLRPPPGRRRGPHGRPPGMDD